MRGSIAVVLRRHMYVVDALRIATCRYVRCETLYTADKKLAEAAEAENVASVLLGRRLQRGEPHAPFLLPRCGSTAVSLKGLSGGRVYGQVGITMY